jgi:hypothetical protein
MITIFGLRLQRDLPVMDLLEKGYVNVNHENHIEIARRYWELRPVGDRYSAIVFVIGDDFMTVHTPDEFLRCSSDRCG